MKAYLAVEMGREKKLCEDMALFNEEMIRNRSTCLETLDLRCVAVADGVGGNAGGAVASEYVLRRLAQKDFTKLTGEELRQFALEVNRDLLAQAGTQDKMATTLTCVVATDEGFYCVHSGNCRLYMGQGAYLKQLTVDQTTCQWLRSCGRFLEAALCNPSEIYCCFGGGDTQYANQLVVEKILPDGLPEVLLLTSDGVHEYVDEDFLESALAQGDDSLALGQILEEAAKNGSTDDKTVIIIRR